jgi:hypothetical protein
MEMVLEMMVSSPFNYLMQLVAQKSINAFLSRLKRKSVSLELRYKHEMKILKMCYFLYKKPYVVL